MTQTTVLKSERSSWNSRSWPRESTSRILSPRSLSFPLSRFFSILLVGTSREYKILVRALGRAPRSADEDARGAPETRPSRLSRPYSRALLSSSPMSRSACLVLTTTISQESTQNLLSTRVYFHNPSPLPSRAFHPYSLSLFPDGLHSDPAYPLLRLART